MAKPVVCVPVKLDAYAFPQSTVAPISQPDYTFLRLDSSLISSDVLPYHDLHCASPASTNPRLTNLATGQPKTQRQGVYLHWMLPRTYRSGATQNVKDDKVDLTAPQFKNAPDRWVIIRHLHLSPDLVEPASALGHINAITGWVVESNRLRNIQTIGKKVVNGKVEYEDVDIEMECSPYVLGSGSLDSMDDQAEVFIGQKNELKGWTETFKKDPTQFVPLHVLGSSNPLFADYTPHNYNVFSILDNFAYQLPDGADAYLTKATASYYVLGWHADETQDPFFNLAAASHNNILSDCLMQMKEGDDAWLGGTDSERVVIHGAMYDVKYTDQPFMATSTAPATQVPANIAGRKLADPASCPITVGTTPLDSVLAYVRAHHDSQAASNGNLRDDGLTDTETDILNLQSLLLSQEEDIDSQQEAQDMLSARNFQDGRQNGIVWHFSSAKGQSISSPPTNRNTKIFEPTDSQIAALMSLNEAQAALDSATRELRAERWNLFSGWWKYVSDITLHSGPIETDLKRTTAAQSSLVQRLENQVNVFTDLVDQRLLPFTDPTTKTKWVESATQQRFFVQRDPSLLVPGLGNPWPNDYLKQLQIRLSTQINAPDLPSSIPDSWKGYPDFVKSMLQPAFPQEDMKTAARILATEFFNLHPEQDNPSFTKVPSGLLPLYHDHVDADQLIKEGVNRTMGGRDQWNNTQPWFPLFVEWEVRYYHIDWHKWAFEQVGVPSRPDDLPRMRYGIMPKTPLKGLDHDERIIHGRVLILPQPGFSIQTNIKNLFAATNTKDLPPDLQDAKKQQPFIDKVSQIEYLSAPLSGFMDHLVTKLNGTHVKPTVRQPGAAIAALPAATSVASAAGYGKAEIECMGVETDKTPYSDYVAFPDSAIAPLKPVTHGQFKFTKLNIIDKFGQVISAIDPAPASSIPPVYPVLSEYFHPQQLETAGAMANTVIEDSLGKCQYAQYPPTINQEARLNSSFMIYDHTQKLWRPCNDFDDPVWGYLVVNYAEYGIQLFLPDGTFYREVRLGGPKGATESLAWLPFDPPDNSDRKMTQGFPQLDNLLDKLQDKGYLRSFITMINASLSSLAHTPTQYADYLGAIVGRPLALVNAGFSLELAAPPLLNQSTRSTTIESPMLTKYPFPVKMGDRDRVFDGLVGYFGCQSGKQAFGSELELKKVYTYFPVLSDRSANDPTTPIVPANYLTMNPYHFSSTSSDPTVPADQFSHSLYLQHISQLQMIGMIIDPFSKVHAYSGILPIASLQLPAWTMQKAMERMTAFFHMGPLIITTPDLQQRYDSTKKLTPDYNIAAMAENDSGVPVNGPPDPAKPAKFTGIPLPSIKKAEWNWLQPYKVSEQVTGNDGSKTSVEVSRWNPFALAQVDDRPRYEPGPYTAVEGFLQLKTPIVAPEPVAPKS